METSEYLSLKRGRKKNPKKDNGELETMSISYEFREGKWESFSLFCRQWRVWDHEHWGGAQPLLVSWLFRHWFIGHNCTFWCALIFSSSFNLDCSDLSVISYRRVDRCNGDVSVHIHVLGNCHVQYSVLILLFCQ